MPIYEYTCGKCNKQFDQLVRSMSKADEVKPPCPACGSTSTARALSVFAVGGEPSGKASASAGDAPMCGRSAAGCRDRARCKRVPSAHSALPQPHPADRDKSELLVIFAAESASDAVRFRGQPSEERRDERSSAAGDEDFAGGAYCGPNGFGRPRTFGIESILSCRGFHTRRFARLRALPLFSIARFWSSTFRWTCAFPWSLKRPRPLITFYRRAGTDTGLQ